MGFDTSFISFFGLVLFFITNTRTIVTIEITSTAQKTITNTPTTTPVTLEDWVESFARVDWTVVGVDWSFVGEVGIAEEG